MGILKFYYILQRWVIRYSAEVSEIYGKIIFYMEFHWIMIREKEDFLFRVNHDTCHCVHTNYKFVFIKNTASALLVKAFPCVKSLSQFCF